MPYVLLLGFYESRYSAEEFMKTTTQPSDFWKFQKNSWNRRVLKKNFYLKFSKKWMSSACQVKDWKADVCAKGKIFQQCRPNIEDTLTIWRKMFSPALNRFLKIFSPRPVSVMMLIQMRGLWSSTFIHTQVVQSVLSGLSDHCISDDWAKSRQVTTLKPKGPKGM